jgi:hypothetical protein
MLFLFDKKPSNYEYFKNFPDSLRIGLWRVEINSDVIVSCGVATYRCHRKTIIFVIYRMNKKTHFHNAGASGLRKKKMFETHCGNAPA